MIAPAQIDRILVPLDGSTLSESVLPAATAVAAACGAALTLLHVLEQHAPETVHGERHLGSERDADAYLRGLAERIADGVPADIHVHLNPEHDVARSIAQHAAELDADMIAMATHGAGGLRGILFGRVAQHVVLNGTAPVLLLRPGLDTPTLEISAIAIGLDGSADGEAALPVAMTIAEGSKARLHLVRVVPTVRTVSGPGAPAATFMPSATRRLLDLEEQEAQRYLDGLRGRLPMQITVTTELLRGDVFDELLNAIEHSHADLVAMSTHGRHGIEGVISGSVGSHLFSRVQHPLVLVRIAE